MNIINKYKHLRVNLKKKNKNAFILTMDVLVWVILLNIISVIFFSSFSFFVKNLAVANDNFYHEILLTECQEVVQWFRYGEWDKNIWTGWENYQAKYPTWFYKLVYDQDTFSWSAEPIEVNGGLVQDLKTIKDNAMDVSVASNYVEFIPLWLDVNWTRDYANGKTSLNYAKRIVYINNDSSIQSIVQCYSHYNYKFKIEEAADWSDYKTLKFIMMDYL